MEDPRLAELQGQVDRLRAEQAALQDSLREARAAAQEAEQAKGDFLANVSHEIRTPMNAILGMTHLTERTELDARQRDYVQTISRAANNLLAIINDILDFSQIEAGKLELDDVEFDLTDVLEDVVTICGTQAEEQGLEFHLRVHPAVPRALVGDPVRLGQVLVNFANNAVKFTEAGRVLVEVSVLADDDEGLQLRLAVTDTGIGMTEDQMTRMFESFSQGDGSKTRRYGGTGLGLVISRQLTELMGGEITVQSTPGLGSTFAATARFMHAGSVTPRFAGASELHDLPVLVLGAPESSEIYAGYLESFGCRIVAGPDDAPALVLAESTATDLEALRKPDAPPKILLITPAIDAGPADGDDETNEELAIDSAATAPQVDTVLRKPVSPGSLFAAVRGLFGAAEPEADAEDASTLSLTEEARAHLSGARVLLAEDDEASQRRAGNLLAELGVELRIADDGRRAVRLVDESWTRREPFDLVLMDTAMPELDGLAATRQLRADSRNAELPIIAMADLAAAADRDAAIAAGMNDQVAKPFDVDHLFRTLMRWIPARDAAVLTTPEDLADDLLVALPVIHGIDAKLGLARTGGNPHRYLELLRRFHDSQEGVLDLIEVVVVNGDTELAVRLAHTLRGTAGTIGADEVFRAAGVLEAAIEHGDARWRQRLQDARVAIGPVISGLAAHMRERAAMANGTLDANAQRVDPVLLDTLAQQLQTFDSAAGQTVTALRTAVGAAAPPVLEEIRGLVESFSFTRAAELIDTLRAALSD